VRGIKIEHRAFPCESFRQPNFEAGAAEAFDGSEDRWDCSRKPFDGLAGFSRDDVKVPHSCAISRHRCRLLRVAGERRAKEKQRNTQARWNEPRPACAWIKMNDGKVATSLPRHMVSLLFRIISDMV
jgi:hypothetical protein